MPSSLIPIDEPLAVTSVDSRLDHEFNFQIVVFEVENTLFKVLRNGFNVPGTPFEAMFTLPQAQMDDIEGSSFENPIHLPGVKADHFRCFLRILYPFIGPTPVVECDEWIGVLNLATMWLFQEIRSRAITKLSDLIKKKTVMERIALARKYRVVEWLRDAYLELIQKKTLNFEELLRPPADPDSNCTDRNWEEDAKKWETLARISQVQIKVAVSFDGGHYRCCGCNTSYGGSYPNGHLCKCRLLRLVNEAFREEFESLREDTEHVEHPLPPNRTDSEWDMAKLPTFKKRKFGA